MPPVTFQLFGKDHAFVETLPPQFVRLVRDGTKPEATTVLTSYSSPAGLGFLSGGVHMFT
jgi:hypothetical protein